MAEQIGIIGENASNYLKVYNILQQNYYAFIVIMH